METPMLRLNNGTPFPQIGFGTWLLRGNEAYLSVLHALKAGYRLIDSAAYYQNEEEVGRAIRDSGIPRKEILITTKLWESGQDDPVSAFRESQKKLGLGAVDLYLLHWPYPKRLECYHALEALVSDGSIRALGVSNFTIRHLEELLSETGLVPAVNQVEFSPFLYQNGLLDYCKNKGILVEAYCPLTRGRKLEHPVIAQIAKERGKSNAQVVLRWCVQHGIVPLPKSKTPARIAENFAISGFSLSQKEMGELDALDEGYRISWNPEEEA